jgi:hypothetical protein
MSGIGHNRGPSQASSAIPDGQLLRDWERNNSPPPIKATLYGDREAVADWLRTHYERLGQTPIAFMSARRLLDEIVKSEGGGRPITSIDDPRLLYKLRHLERTRQLRRKT